MECKISDQTLSRAQKPAHASLPSAKRKPADEISEQNAASKKRKTDEPDSADPKLREFLQVMGSAKESALADGIIADHDGAAEEAPQVAVPEGESDDEYEQIPSRRDQQRKSEPLEKKPLAATYTTKAQEQAQGQQQQDKTADDPQGETLPDRQDELEAPGEEKGAQAATDDDWLRSRTNRLLDLMDPEDLPAVQADDEDGAPLKQDTRDNLEPAEAEAVAHDATADDVANDEPGSRGHGDEDTAEAIRRTSRLFVRNLAYGASEEDIRECFQKFGTVEEVR